MSIRANDSDALDILRHARISITLETIETKRELLRMDGQKGLTGQLKEIALVSNLMELDRLRKVVDSEIERISLRGEQ